MNSDYYNNLYTNNKQYFGDHPDNLLRDYYHLCDKKGRILDIGIGQGRNARFLLQHGYGVDGIDISTVAIDNLNEWVSKENLDLQLFNKSFENYSSSSRSYSAILVFGIFSVLSIPQIDHLTSKIEKWLKRDGILFLTGMTTQENFFKPQGEQWKQIAADSYADDEGNFRTFMDMHDVLQKFRKFKPIYQWEGYGERHDHGTGQVEQHHIFEIILQKHRAW